MRRGSIVQLVVDRPRRRARSPLRSPSLVPWLPTSGVQAGRADRLHLLVRDGDLARASSRSSRRSSIYALINFRAKPGDLVGRPADPRPHDDSRSSGRSIPAVLVTAISIVSAIVLAQNGNAGAEPAHGQASIGQQFAWTFTVPERQDLRRSCACRSTGAVKLEITADDVIHSFWVPQFAQKQDAVPGQSNDLVITPDPARARSP